LLNGLKWRASLNISTAAISFRRRITGWAAGNARHNPLAATGVVLVLLFVIFALFAPWIAPQDPAAINLPARLDSPSHGHWFGTDELGRDILSRIIHGARISMLVGTSVVAASLSIGLIVGCIAGYYGGRVDRFVNVILMNAFLSFPGILLAIAFVAFLGPGIFNLIARVGPVDQVEMFRVFNMGVGYVLIVRKADVGETLSVLKNANPISSGTSCSTSWLP
jgi:ABC-type dipeptide/oligopeptide/nickel transport system permease subunit